MARKPVNLETMLEEENTQRDLQQVKFAEPEDVFEAEAIEPPMTMPVEEEAQVSPSPVQVAGRVTDTIDVLSDMFTKRVDRAVREATPSQPPEMVKQEGDDTVLRQATPDEEEEFAETIGVVKSFTKGLNLPAIGEAAENIDLGNYLQKVKDGNAELFEKARRGTISYDQLLQGAEERGIDNMVIEFMKKKPGDAAVAEDVLAALIGAMEISKRVKKQAEYAFTVDNPELREQAFQQAAKLAASEAILYANISGAASEFGRGLFAMGQAGRAGLLREGRAEEIMGIMADESVENMEAFFERYLALPDAKSKSKFIQQSTGGKIMDYLAEGFVNSILSSPVTHMVNIAGNTGFGLMKGFEETLAGSIGLARSAVTGNKERYHIREGLIQLDSFRSGLMNALIVAGKTFKMGEPVSEMGEEVATKIDLRRKRSFGSTDDFGEVMGMYAKGEFGQALVNTYGIYYRMASRFLVTEDEFFKAIAYQADIKKQALNRQFDVYDQIIKQGGTKEDAHIKAATAHANALANPTKPMRTDAKAAAQELTFTGDLDGMILNSLGKFAAHPLVKMMAIPFFKTPIHIMSETFKRSPFALANPNFYKAIKAGGREADIAMARMALGTGTMALMAYSSTGLDRPNQDRIIVGNGPTDKEARQAMIRMGIQPYSVNIRRKDENGKYVNAKDGTPLYDSYTFSRFDPISGQLAMAADFAYYAQHAEFSWDDPATVASTLAELAGHAGMAGVKYSMEMPYLQGFSEWASVFVSGDDEALVEAMMRMGMNKAGQVLTAQVPLSSSFGGAIERVGDPTVGEGTMISEEAFEDIANLDINSLPPSMQGFYAALQTAMSRHPFFSDRVPDRLNVWGEPIKSGKGVGYEVISPVRIQEAKYGGVDLELVKLGDGISMPKRTIDGVRLSAEQYNRFIYLYNNMDYKGNLPIVKDKEGNIIEGSNEHNKDQRLLSEIESEISSLQYRQLPTADDKLDVIKSIVSSVRSAARMRLYEEYPELKAQIDAVQ